MFIHLDSDMLDGCPDSMEPANDVPQKKDVRLAGVGKCPILGILDITL